MQPLELSYKAYQYYRKFVKNNSNTSYDQASRKLTRNIKLAYKKKSLIDFIKRQKTYVYGQLKIVVNKDNVITEVHNDPVNFIEGWTKNEAEYAYLGKVLRIKDYKDRRKQSKQVNV